MRFANPSILWLLLLVPLVAWFLVWAMGRRKELLGRFATEKVLSRGEFLRNAMVVWVRMACMLLGILFLILALARPQWGFHERQVVTQGVDMMIAIDTSASMMARDYPPSRMARAKDLLRNLIWEAKGNRVGIVAFAGSAAVMCPLTLDYNMASTALKAVDMNTVSARGTNIGAAINSAVGAFEISGANDRVLVLLTDGEQLEQQDVLNAAIAKAKEAGVYVFAIGLGSEDGSTIPTLRGPLRDSAGQVVDTRLDFELLKRIAEETGGEAYRAQKIGAGEIAQISAELAKFRGQKQQDKTFRVYHERYPLFAGAALLFLVVEALLRGVRRLGRSRRNSAVQTGIAALFAVALLTVSGTAVAYPGESFVRSRDALQKYQQGNYDTAMQQYEQATNLDPQNNQLTYNLGATAAKAGHTSEAKTILGKVYDPENELLNIKARYGVATVTHREIRKHISENREEWATSLAQGDKDAKAAVEATIRDLKQVIGEYRDVILAQPEDLDPKANYEIAKRDLEELEKLLKDNEQQQQQQQDEQQQDNEEQEEDEQKQGGEQDEQTDQEQQGDEGKDQEEQQQEQQQADNQDRNEQGDQQQDQQNPGEGNQEQEQDGEQQPDQQPGKEGDKPGQEQQPDQQGKPTPTPAPQGSPTPAPSPTPSPTGTPGAGNPEGEGDSPGGQGEPIPVGQMSPTDVDRLLNTLPPENQQALQLMMGAPTEEQDMQHEW